MAKSNGESGPRQPLTTGSHRGSANTPSPSRMLGRVLAAWLAMAIAMSANGVFRELVLKRWLSTPAADTASAVIGAGIILLLTSFFFRPLVRASSGILRLASLMLVVLTVSFEFAVGRLVDHKTWGELLGNYAIWRGRLWPLLLLLIALTPFIWGRWLASEPARKRDHPS